LHQLRQESSSTAMATFQSRGGRTSPIIVDANFNTAAAISAACNKNELNSSNNSNNIGISKMKNGGKRRSVGTSQRILLGRNKNKKDVGDSIGVVAAPPPPMPSNVDDNKGVPISASAAVVSTSVPTPAPPSHLYAEIIVPTTRRRPSRYQMSSSSAGIVVAPYASTSTGIDHAESQDDNVSLAFTSVSSMTGRSSLFGPMIGGSINPNNANNGTMPQNLLSSLLWCPFGGGDTSGAGGEGSNHRVSTTLKEAEAEDYFDYSNMNGNVPGGVLANENTKGGGESDADEDAGGGMITKLLGVWNETLNSTCQCFDMGVGDEEGGQGVNSLGMKDEVLGDGSSPPDVGTIPPSMTAKNSGKSIATYVVDVRGGGGGGETRTTANDTTATMISKKSSHHSLQKVPTFSEPLEG
jgi:hypothetical protein